MRQARPERFLEVLQMLVWYLTAALTVNTHHKRHRISQHGRKPATAIHLTVEQSASVIDAKEYRTDEQGHSKGAHAAVLLSQGQSYPSYHRVFCLSHQSP